MKKIFILPILILPIVAHATDPIGPAHVNSGAVVATASAPYATAREETGDTTNVVSASYVKGAYNDAIAAINKVVDDIYNEESLNYYPINISDGNVISVDVLSAQIVENELSNGNNFSTADDLFMSAAAVINAIDYKTNIKRINAVTTWGNDTPTQLTLTTASN